MVTSTPPATPALAVARSVLERTFGYPDFRGVQAGAVQAVLEGRDVLILMPTGGGKSLCYQIPALVLPGLTLVVSPLISLMKDQVDALVRRGVPATFVNSTLSAETMRARLGQAERGDLKLLYIAPERFLSAHFAEILERLRIDRLAIDEAHCVSEWGRDFRPAYMQLGAERRKIGCPLVALTATATPLARADIVHHLGMREPVVLAGGFDRPNLTWRVEAVRDESDRSRRLLHLLKRSRKGAAIVYAPTRRRVDTLADRINRAGLTAAGYHAGAAGEERQRLQDWFMAAPTPILVATNAFGMGIDKPNVRLVVHQAMPGNLEAYYQEAGRAGRDGGPAECVLLHMHSDRRTHEFLIDQAHPVPEAVRSILDVLRSRGQGRESASIGLQQLAQDSGLPGGSRQAVAAVRALERSRQIRVTDLIEQDGGTVGSVTFRFEPETALSAVWRAVREDRERELGRLLWVQRYATHRGCRRGFLLCYFGEAAVRGACGNCDRCMRSGSPAPGAPAHGRRAGIGGRMLQAVSWFRASGPRT